MSVNVGQVATFPGAKADKAQALKPLEEAAEVFGAWQGYVPFQGTRFEESRRADLMDECCDVIQAACNMLAALGVEDATGLMERCRERNEGRGRL